VSSTFGVQTEQGTLRGLVAWVEYTNRVYQILGYTSEQRWSAYQNAFTRSIGSFARETDSAVLNAQPRRLDLVNVSRQTTFDALVRDYPSTVSPQVVGLINSLQPGATVPAGDGFKRVVGGRDW